MKVYFATLQPLAARQLTRNTNGLLRQYFPKGTDLSGYTQEQLDAVLISSMGVPG